MNNEILSSSRSSEKIELSLHIDSELVEKIKHLSNNPSKIVETALKEWLKGERRQDDDLTRSLRRNPPVPPRGEWND
ncbi:hypothetical protein AA637_13855 [Cyanobacterium sp. HL-69]|uniref:type II toxin-antitoxin system CcdA family antitoxin n=1 Tax=Cyanobacterium sp. HL-69 TaxID=2054282 RepID=UPI000CA33D35|nr:hypothetical protein AA637_13855 [Cyanobacterium sp. HL-69]